MTTVAQHLAATDSVFCNNIASLTGHRGLLSQNLLSQMRNLVEGAAVYLHTRNAAAKYDYAAIEAGMAEAKKNGRLRFVRELHHLLRPSTSHYTFDGDTSERLMLRYYEYLLRLRGMLHNELQVDILGNLEDFPLDQDPALYEYHEKIAAKIDVPTAATADRRDRFYIHKTRPFVVDGRVFYEVTFYKAVNRASKSDRIIGFTSIDIADNYSANLGLQESTIEVFGQSMPILIIRNWQVSIRPCELEAFARVVGRPVNRIYTTSDEYKAVMAELTSGSTLLDLIGLPADRYSSLKARATASTKSPQIFPALDEARRITQCGKPGTNVLRYLLLRMRNEVLKAQHSGQPNARLSNLRLAYGCVPFDKMPFCTALIYHNPRLWDLINSIDATERKHELLARRVQRNVEDRGILYTPLSELQDLDAVQPLIATYNSNLYSGHRPARDLVLDKGYVFIQGYEDDTYEVVSQLQGHAASGINGYSAAVQQWLGTTDHQVTDAGKQQALISLFAQSRVALIYGAAGTGKTFMVNHIANYFASRDKLFLAHTHPAVENLRRRVEVPNAIYRTVAKHKNHPGENYDLLVIDECSTVSNADLLNVLQNTTFKLLVLVGDVHQIESIRFGNWFNVIRSYINPASVFELTTPYRTTSTALIDLWTQVRNLDEEIPETLARNGYSTVLDASLFDQHDSGDIILALNYDGLYGINNINRFLQASNPNPPVRWGPAIFKVGDPILFSHTNRFRGLLYNNLKGSIVAIDAKPGSISFEVKVDMPITELDVSGYQDVEWVADSTIRFAVYDYDISDEDDDTDTTTVPFQVAYAVGIHKAQGLEYETVKVVITSANEDDITPNIFYTAITRARKDLRIYWSPETQQAVLVSLRPLEGHRDVALLSARRGLTPGKRK